MEEIVVTATRRTSSVMDVPFSVNVQEEADIQRLNTFSLEGLSRNIAGLNIQNLGPGQNVITIRGISSGQIVRDQPGVKEQVGVYLDDTPISLSLFTPDLDLYDVQRVETLRGPQGTLFGSGSIGGTVRYVTNKPQLGVKEVRTQFDLNTIDSGTAGGHVKAAVNAPLGDNAAVRVTGYGTRYGGFIDALRATGETTDNVNDGGRFGGRVSVLWKPTENITITPRLVYQNIDMDGFNREEFFNLFANPYATTRTPVQLGERQQFLLLNEAFEDETLILDNVVKWNINNRFDATYVASYTKRDLLVSRDSSALAGSVGVTFKDLALPGHPTDPAAVSRIVSLPSNLVDTTGLEQMTHEVRLSSTDVGPLQWQAGVFYSNIKRNYSQRVPTPGYDSHWANRALLDATSNGFTVQNSPYNSNLTYDLRQIAVFGEATYTFFDRLGVTAGLRWYDWEEDKTFKSGGIFSNGDAQSQNRTVSSNGLTPRFMVDYDVTDRVAVNAQASQGFRLGGVNDPLNAPLCGNAYETYRGFQRFKDETLWNYEVGLKSSYEKVTLNAVVVLCRHRQPGGERGGRSMFIACDHQRARSPYHGWRTGVRRTPHGCLVGHVCRQLRGGGIRFHGSGHGEWGRACRHRGRQPHPVRPELATVRGGDVYLPGSPAIKGELRHRLLAIRRRSDHPSRRPGQRTLSIRGILCRSERHLQATEFPGSVGTGSIPPVQPEHGPGV